MWVQYQTEVALSISETGFVVRDHSTSSLLCDLPRASIKLLERLDSNMIKISSHSTRTEIALKFKSEVEVNQCTEAIRIIGYECTIPQQKIAHDTMLPNLDDQRVQELIVKLLYSDNFRDFVAEIGALFEGMRRN